MSIGKKFVVTIAFNESNGNPFVESLDLGETFSYADEGDPYLSATQVMRDDRNGIDNDIPGMTFTLWNRYIVTFFWADGDEPNVVTYTVNNFLLDAMAEISNAGYIVPIPD